MTNGKIEYRKKAENIVKALSRSDIKRISHQISINIMKLAIWEKSDAVFCYLCFREEPDMDRLIKTALKEGKKTGCPD